MPLEAFSMMSRVWRSICVSLCLAVAACGGVESEEVDPAQGAAPASAAAVSGDSTVEAQGLPPGCGNLRQRCCEPSICYNGLECDPATRTCLY
jgi:hypothetical protein